MAVAGRTQDRAVMGGASPLLRFRVYRGGDTHIRLLRHMQGLHDCGSPQLRTCICTHTHRGWSCNA